MTRKKPDLESLSLFEGEGRHAWLEKGERTEVRDGKEVIIDTKGNEYDLNRQLLKEASAETSDDPDEREAWRLAREELWRKGNKNASRAEIASFAQIYLHQRRAQKYDPSSSKA